MGKAAHSSILAWRILWVHSMLCIVHWVTTSWTWLSDFRFHFPFCSVVPITLLWRSFCRSLVWLTQSAQYLLMRKLVMVHRAGKYYFPFTPVWILKRNTIFIKTTIKASAFFFLSFPFKTNLVTPFCWICLEIEDSLIPDVLILFFYIDNFLFCLLFLFLVSGENHTHDPIIFSKMQVSMESELISQTPFALWSWISEGAYYKLDITLTSHWFCGHPHLILVDSFILNLLFIIFNIPGELRYVHYRENENLSIEGVFWFLKHLFIYFWLHQGLVWFVDSVALWHVGS